MQREPGEQEARAVRDGLAVDRTALANERTLLAYIRTAIAVLATAVGLPYLFRTPHAMLAGWALGVASVLLLVWECSSRFRTEVRRCGITDEGVIHLIS